MSPTTLLGEIDGRGEEGDRGWDGWMTHQFIGHGLGRCEGHLGDGEGQGSLACCSPQGHGVGHDLVTEQHGLLHITWAFCLLF